MPPTSPPERLTARLSVEALLLWACLFWTAAANWQFVSAALTGRVASEASSWGFAIALVTMVLALHFVLISPWAWRPTVKPLLAVLSLVVAFASFYMQTFGVYLDPSMLRNVLQTDVAESRELLSPALLWHLLLYAGLPLLLLWRVRVTERRWLPTLAFKLGSWALALALLVGAVLAVFQPFASLMRNQKELRYLVTPGNALWSLGVVVSEQVKGAAQPRQAIGLDAQAGERMLARTKTQTQTQTNTQTQTRPLLVVMVVGETARAANWGLSGYARQTTPELAQLPVINFAQVTSCGTNTEVSLPCMFAPVGRRDYDEDRIRGSESLLHLLNRAGVAVHWLDNQSGCKGVCDGLSNTTVLALNPPGLCKDGRCLDEGLLVGLEQKLVEASAASSTRSATAGTQLLVLHQLGNHGPAYFRRYPPAFEKFTPTCQFDDLQRCSQAEIVNAYDNALLYTDHVLARLVKRLQAAAGEVDSVLLYVSDHGESLGENNLYLHGLPYRIAPDLQERVPMVMWLSAGAAANTGVDAACLQQRATKPATHDHLFHTLLSLLDVRTRLREPAWDLTEGCRR